MAIPMPRRTTTPTLTIPTEAITKRKEKIIPNMDLEKTMALTPMATMITANHLLMNMAMATNRPSSALNLILL